MLGLTKRVSVTFAGNDEVITHILPDDVKLKATKYKVKPELAEDEDDDLPNEASLMPRPSSSLADEDDVFGAELYGFKTPKKSGQMTQKAVSSAQAIDSPKTPKSAARNKSARTPKSILKTRASLLQESGQTPVTKRAQKRLHKISGQTPHRLRTRNKKREQASSESDDSAGSVSDWEDDTSSTYSEPVDSCVSSTVIPPVTANTAAAQAENVEHYFAVQAEKGVTSDHTLAKLDIPRMDAEQLNKALEKVEIGFSQERKALKKSYFDNFDKWMYLMCNKFNILLHGVGSKIEVIEEFRRQRLADFDHLVINGFFPSLTIKQILNGISEDVLGEKSCSRGVLDHCELITQHYNTADCSDLYLVIHNIDGPMLRAEKAQNVLSLLAQATNIHVIASIDHINAPLMWDQTKASRYNWLWYDVTSYDAYSEETSYENSLLVSQSGVLALSSLTHVMRSLTPNAKAIFLLIARYQLENKQQHYQGLAFPDLYQKCREAFLVNSDLTLRSQLTEFKDHKLIRSKKGIDGAEYLVIALEEATLKEFLAQQDDDT